MAEKQNNWALLSTILSVCDLMELIQLEKINEHQLIIKTPSSRRGEDKRVLAKLTLLADKIELDVTNGPDQRFTIVKLLKEFYGDVNKLANAIIKSILPEEDPDTLPHYKRGAVSNNRTPIDDMSEELETLIECVFSVQFPQEKWNNKPISYYFASDNGTFYGQKIEPNWAMYKESCVEVKNFKTGQMEIKSTFMCANYHTVDFFVLVQELYEDHKLGPDSKYTDFADLLSA